MRRVQPVISLTPQRPYKARIIPLGRRGHWGSKILSSFAQFKKVSKSSQNLNSGQFGCKDSATVFTWPLSQLCVSLFLSLSLSLSPSLPPGMDCIPTTVSWGKSFFSYAASCEVNPNPWLTRPLNLSEIPGLCPTHSELWALTGTSWSPRIWEEESKHRVFVPPAAAESLSNFTHMV